MTTPNAKVAKGPQIVIPKSLMKYQTNPIDRKDLQSALNDQQEKDGKRTTLRKIIMKKGKSSVEVGKVEAQSQSKSSALITMALQQNLLCE